MEKFISDVSKKEFPKHERVAAHMLGKPIFNAIQKDHPDFNEQCSLSYSELGHYRKKYISDFINTQMGELNEMEQKVIDALNDKSLLSESLKDDDTKKSTFGQRVADRVATFGGSWTFIISFVFFLLIWIASNVFLLMDKGFDPYPFILLNLILSCIAALQAPVIMMSQNRQEEKDRDRAKNDYMVNLKSELEIRILHEKLDHLILHQEQSLIEIQKVQIDMMSDILKRLEKKQ